MGLNWERVGLAGMLFPAGLGRGSLPPPVPATYSPFHPAAAPRAGKLHFPGIQEGSDQLGTENGPGRSRMGDGKQQDGSCTLSVGTQPQLLWGHFGNAGQ